MTVIAVVLIIFGGWVFSIAFKKGYQKLGPVIMGSALILAGFYLLPSERGDQPEIYYRK